MRFVLTIVLVHFCACLKTQVSDGLVAGFTFNNEELRDITGKHQAVARFCSFGPDRFGNSRSACFIPGNYGTYLNLGTSPDLKQKTGTIALWFRINMPVYKGEGTPYNPILYTRSHTGEDFNEAFFAGYNVDDGYLGCGLTVSDVKQVATYTTSRLSLRKWHHLVLSWDDNYFNLYLDGVLENRSLKNFDTEYLEGDSVLLGHRSGFKNNRFYNGYVDDIYFYDRVLSAAEVQLLFNAPDPNRPKVWLFRTGYGVAAILLVLVVIRLVKARERRLLNAERERAAEKANMQELEIKLLKSQMNPHFVFNALNSIQQLVATGRNEAAKQYLGKFSVLMRSVLESNTRNTIQLTEEITILKNYLEIESLRFGTVFVHSVEADPSLEPDRIYIPHFLVQPFVENAIWHGLLPKQGERRVSVRFSPAGAKKLCCTIEDNGVGREKAGQLIKMREKISLAVQLIQQRLEIFSVLFGREYEVVFEDLYATDGTASGTRAIIHFPFSHDEDITRDNH